MLQTMENFSNVIGIIGVCFVLIAFFLLNTHKLTPKQIRYQLLNFFGSWLILFSLLYHWNLSSVIIEIAWITISLIGIFKALKFKKTTLA